MNINSNLVNLVSLLLSRSSCNNSNNFSYANDNEQLDTSLFSNIETESSSSNLAFIGLIAGLASRSDSSYQSQNNYNNCSHNCNNSSNNYNSSPYNYGSSSSQIIDNANSGSSDWLATRLFGNSYSPPSASTPSFSQSSTTSTSNYSPFSNLFGLIDPLPSSSINPSINPIPTTASDMQPYLHSFINTLLESMGMDDVN